MRDIRGIDAAGSWPLAPGWWVVGLGVLGIVLAAWYARRHYRRWLRFWREPWRSDAVRHLSALERRIGRDDPKEVATALSELVRRIAVARCGRAACAGLIGERWLAWLNDHDPAGFDWTRHQGPLLGLPYAPPGVLGASAADLRPLLAAARVWAEHPAPCPTFPAKDDGHGV